MARISKPALSWIELLMLLAVLAILASIIIPSVGPVRGPSRNAVDTSNLRQIAMAALIYAHDNRGQLPGLNLNQEGQADESVSTPNIHAIAAALARGGYLNDASFWISRSDRHPKINFSMDRPFILDRETPRSLNPEFSESALSFQFVAGLNRDMPDATPVAFTRGLRPDGHWVDDVISVYGADGGHIAFLDASVAYYRNLEGNRGRLTSTARQPTANILETIDSTQRIFSYPATPTGAVDGTPGIGERSSKAK